MPAPRPRHFRATPSQKMLTARATPPRLDFRKRRGARPSLCRRHRGRRRAAPAALRFRAPAAAPRLKKRKRGRAAAAGRGV
eukprot:gene25469-biopygen2994